MNLIFLAASTVMLAPPQNPDYIETAWIVQPDDSQTGERDVRDGEYVIKHRLLPPSLIQLKEDAVEKKSGKVMAKAGDQLFGVLTAGSPVFCVTSLPKQTALRSLLITSGNVQRCMVDTDKDGKLDGHFGAGNAIPGLPNFMTKRSKKPKPLTGGAYDLIDPKLDNSNFFVGIKFEGTVGIIRKEPIPTFSIRFGTDANNGRLTYDTRPENKTMPFDVTVLDANFQVLSREGDVIKTRVHQAMPEQRFGVVMVTY